MEIKELTFGHEFPLTPPISLTIRPGQPVALVGPNGVGKTTLIHTLLNLLPALSGSVVITGTRGVQFQDRALPLNVTTSQWITHQSRLWHTPVNHTMLEHLGLSNSNERIRHLSLGNQQKLALYTAMHHQPSNLFLDEPTNNLDFPSRNALYEIVAAMHHTSVVVASHSAHDITGFNAQIFNLGSRVNDAHALVTFSQPLISIPADIEIASAGYIIRGENALERAQQIAQDNNVTISSFMVIS